ncbi:MAG TPA: vitamin B12-dependent ribonucleotide reductase, partial [Acidisoma sp.]|uniref:hypothetical protein n=1 Tax=Acidisoma sp. TaxID=1872115 RepID=UPI002BBCAC40|nr:vitamin B12-dependent ribonucleotide reductase [Acidisoma sp.]
IFRELAISYIARNDLAHVDPADLMPDTIGNGAAEGNLPRTGNETAEQARSMLADIQRGVSKGFVRGTIGVPSATPNGGIAASTSLRPAMMAEAVTPADDRSAKMREAKVKGYEGDSCPECGNFTMVRNGTCLKCVTCGSTSGCS